MGSRLLLDPRRALAAAQDEARRRYLNALAGLVASWDWWLDEPTRANAARYSVAFSAACETLSVVWLAGGLLVPPSEARGLAAGRLFMNGFPLPPKLLVRLRRRYGAVAYRLRPVVYPGAWN